MLAAHRLIILASPSIRGQDGFCPQPGQELSPPSHQTYFGSLLFAGNELRPAVQRILKRREEILMEKISRGKLEDHEISSCTRKGIDKLAKAPIFIDDTPA